MGNFWGSIHVRSEDRDALVPLLTEIAADGQVKFYIGPPVGGWIAIYPHEHGQDTKIGQRIASATKLDAFHLILHDDDVFAYNFFKGGEMVDEYVSTPGYFSDNDRASEEKLVGNPALYADLLKQPLLKVKSLLLEDRGAGSMFDEMERITKFAKALGLTNVQTSYEYLDEGEAHGVKFRRQFIHIPGKAIEKEADQSWKQVLKEEKRRLKSQGFLLAEYASPKHGWISCRSDTLGGGFVLGIHRQLPEDKPSLLRTSSPWPAKPPPIEAAIPSAVHAFAVDPTGEHLAAICGFHPDQMLEIWNLRLQQRTGRIHIWGFDLRFSPDSLRLLVVDRESTHIIDVAAATIVRTIPTKGAQRAIAHPSGGTVLIEQQTSVLYVPLPQGEPHAIYLGGRTNAIAAIQASMRRQFATLDLVQLEPQLRAQMEKNFAKLDAMFTKRSGKKGNPEWNDTTRAKAREDMEKQIQKTLEGIKNAGETSPRDEGHSIERVSDFAVSADGTMLFCATHMGLRVYHWSDIASGESEVRRTKYAFQSIVKRDDGATYPAQMTAVAEDFERGRLLFGGVDGVLYSMNLADGQVTSFRQMPTGVSITGICISGDRAAVACICHEDTFQFSKQPRPPVVYIWNAETVP